MSQSLPPELPEHRPGSASALTYETPAARRFVEMVEDAQHPEAEAWLDARCAPQDLRNLFSTPEAAAEYYIRGTTRRMEQAHPSDRCFRCGALPVDQAVRVQWEGKIGAGGPSLGDATSRDTTLGFYTVHPFCDACGRSLRSRLSRRRLLKKARVVAGIAAPILLYVPAIFQTATVAAVLPLVIALGVLVVTSLMVGGLDRAIVEDVIPGELRPRELKIVGVALCERAPPVSCF